MFCICIYLLGCTLAVICIPILVVYETMFPLLGSPELDK